MSKTQIFHDNPPGWEDPTSSPYFIDIPSGLSVVKTIKKLISSDKELGKSIYAFPLVYLDQSDLVMIIDVEPASPAYRKIYFKTEDDLIIFKLKHNL